MPIDLCLQTLSYKHLKNFLRKFYEHARQEGIFALSKTKHEQKFQARDFQSQNSAIEKEMHFYIMSWGFSEMPQRIPWRYHDLRICLHGARNLFGMPEKMPWKRLMTLQEKHIAG